MTKVITIGRQFGSAGHDIGEMIAKELGYQFYDKELVEMAAKKENISTDAVKDMDEKATSSLLYSLASETTMSGAMPTPSKLSENGGAYIEVERRSPFPPVSLYIV